MLNRRLVSTGRQYVVHFQTPDSYILHVGIQSYLLYPSLHSAADCHGSRPQEDNRKESADCGDRK